MHNIYSHESKINLISVIVKPDMAWGGKERG